MAQRVREVVREVTFLDGSIGIHFHNGILSELAEIREPLPTPHNKVVNKREEEELAQIRRE